MEIRISDDSVELSGYVNAVGRESLPLRDRDGYFIEVAEPGIFARSLAKRPSIPMLLDHDPGRVIAKDGEMILKEDNIGLYTRAVSKDPEVRQKAIEGKLRGWSFGFKAIRAKTDERGGLRYRTLEEIDLREVSLIDDLKNPAYPATSVYTRDDSNEEIEFRFLGDDLTVNDQRTPEAPSLREWNDRIDALGVIEE